jgi:hypothetical protein
LQTSDVDIEFRRVLLESIDETLPGLLGDEPFRVLFERLGNDFHLKHEEIPDRLEEFETVLTFVLLPVAPVITRAIARCLYAKLQIPYRDRKDYTLKMYVRGCKGRVKQLGAKKASSTARNPASFRC